ncbi:MAG: septum formation initiator family protein [Actinomycetota bacterium]|nr:septum formation initiator family protein [Actinomycetota bacterium]
MASTSPGSPSGTGLGGSMTSRALILIAVFALLVLALSVPVRAWLSQRAEVAALRADIAASSERIAELQTELTRWSDPAFVATEARRRLHFVLPGEIGYVTISSDGRPAEAVLSEAAAAAPRGWHSVVWESIERADGPPIAAVDPAS